MNIEKYIQYLASQNIFISVNDGELKLKATQESLTPEVLKEIKLRKEEILEFYQKFSEGDEYRPLVQAAFKDRYAVSSAQKRLYFLYELDKDSITYNMPQIVGLKGGLDLGRLENAFMSLVQRHDSLRTSFEQEDGEVFQKIVDRSDLKLDFYDSTEPEVQTIISSFIRPFDLNQSPLFRVGLIKLSDQSHILMVDMHHIISDGTSQGILIRDFMALYDQKILPEQKFQYKDYTEWQRGNEVQEQKMIHREFWEKEFLESESFLDLPTDFSRPLMKNFSGNTTQFSLSSEQTTHLRTLTAEVGGTMFMTVLSLLNVLLGKLSNQEDIVVGTPVSGREHADLENIIGMFVNTFPLRNYPARKSSFLEFLKSVKEKTLSCFHHQSFQYEELVETLNIPRDTSRNPLFDVLLSFQNFEAEALDIPNLTLVPQENAHTVSKFDLTFTAAESEKQLLFNVEYSTELFKEETIQRFISYFKRIVCSVTKDPAIKLNSIDILSSGEKRELLEDFNNTRVQYPRNSTIVDLFESQAAQMPDSIALVHREDTMNYSTLNNQANQLTEVLKKHGVDKNRVVGLMLDRSFEMIVSIIGTLKAGGAYLPIDADYPESRIEYMLANSEVGVLLVDEQTSGAMKNYSGTVVNISTLDFSEKKVENPVAVNTSSDLGYVIYTSGSTGTPKGVMLKHSNLTNLVNFDHSGTNIDFSCVLQFTTLSFDPSFREIFSTLLHGGQLVLVDQEDTKDVARLFSIIKEHEVRTLFMPGSLLNQLFNDEAFADDVPLGVRHIISAGEQTIIGETFKKYLSENEIYIHNHYGPSETHVITGHTVDPFQAIPSQPCIGKPIFNTQIYILDSESNLQPIGVPGELYAGGEQVGLGYLNNESLTEEKFVPNPFIDGDRLYRTGDLARWLPGGDIEFLGRLDDQVKIRGFRVELGEVESQFSRYEGVKEAVVIARTLEDGKCLIGYYVSDTEIVASNLRSYLSAQLPDFMVPSYFIYLDSLPLTPNGKVNRKALPTPGFIAGQDHVNPNNEVEEKLLHIWSGVLNIAPEAISTTKSFFELGGHSLRAMSMVNKISKELSVSIPLKSIFVHQDIISQASLIKISNEHAHSKIEKAEKSDYYPISYAQRRMYFLYELDKKSTAYNLPQVVELHGPLNQQKLENAFQKLVQHHTILRTTFELVDEQVVQKINDTTEFKLDYFEEKLEDIPLVLRNFVQPFVLNEFPQLRVGVMKISSSHHILMVDIHHILTDGVSQGILIKDFVQLYNGDELPKTDLEYVDYAIWQQSAEQKANLVDQRQFWISEFADEVTALDLPYDFTRPGIKNHSGGTVGFKLTKPETAALKRIGSEQGATMFMVVLSIFNVLLSKLSDQEDIVIGTPVAGRDHVDLSRMIGMFVNTLCLRNRPKGRLRFKDFLLELKNRTLEGFNNQSYPYEELIDVLRVVRDTSRNPLFDAMLIFQNYESESMVLSDLEVKPYSIDHKVSKFDLTLVASEYEKVLYLNFEYSTELFEEGSIKQFIRYFQSIVKTVVSNPETLLSRIEILSFAERDKLLHEYNKPFTNLPQSKTIIDLFDDQVQLNPNKTALIFGKEDLTYGELSHSIDQVASALLNEGIVKGSIVAVMCERSFDLWIGILSIMKSGAAYLPIDPGYPQARIDYILEDSGVDMLVTSRKVENPTLPASIRILNIQSLKLNQDIDLVESKANLESLAYVIYTSGSSGKPKGVEITHDNLINFSLGIPSEISFLADSSILSLTTVSFDIFALESLLPLTRGMKIVIASELEQEDPSLLCRLIEDQGINMLQLTPSRLKLIHSYDTNLKSLGKVESLMIGGEQFTENSLLQLQSLYMGNIYNMYGPTETTIWSSVQDLTHENRVTIGQPILNTTLYVLDRYKNLTPIGVPGELYIGGSGVGRGYLNNHVLTEEKFITNPFNPEQRLYGTGDLVRRLFDGNIEFLSRIDDQIKIRGFRVELGEIEYQLSQHPDINDETVIASEKEGEKLLIGYYAASSQISHTELHDHMAKELPAYMLPSFYVHLDSIPMTPNGKIDRRALPDPELSEGIDYEGPKNEIEEKLVEIWSEVLLIDEAVISVTRSFFELGGHSLRASTMLNKIWKFYPVYIPLVEVFQKQTIRALADFIKICHQTELETDDMDEITI